MTISKAYENIFEALEDDPVVTENLRLRTEMMIRLRTYIKEKGLSHQEAALHMGVTQKEIELLSTGKIDSLTIDLLINMLSHIGVRVGLVLEQAA